MVEVRLKLMSRVRKSKGTAATSLDVCDLKTSHCKLWFKASSDKSLNIAKTKIKVDKKQTCSIQIFQFPARSFHTSPCFHVFGPSFNCASAIYEWVLYNRRKTAACILTNLPRGKKNIKVEQKFHSLCPDITDTLLWNQFGGRLNCWTILDLSEPVQWHGT